MLETGFRFVILMLALAGCMGLSSCSDSSRNASNSAPDQFQDNLTATEILSTVVQQYQTAASYSDHGVLYLTYRIDGRWIQEPQPFSTAWNRNGKYAADLFNAQIRCDGNLLSCYVFDIESANLDNQHLLIPTPGKIPLNDVFDDNIASHFLKGSSEFPMDESQKHQRPDLVPLIIGLLTDQTDVQWFTQPQNIQRLKDEVYDNLPCFVLQVADVSGNFRFWIDQGSGVIHQVELPLEYLDTKVLAATEITDLKFAARFHQAQLNGPIADDTFAIKLRAGSTPVRHFVALPESFPCEMIGQTAPDFDLQTPNDKTVSRHRFDGKVAALFWLGDIGAKESIKELDQLMGRFDRDKFNFAVIYSDAELTDPLSQSADMKPELKQFVTKQAIRMDFYYDRKMNASTLLKVKSVPSVVVLDSSAKIQFAVTTADGAWIDKLDAAMNRVAAGEDVSAEMKREYQSYLENYHQQLLAATTSQPAGGKSKNTADDSVEDSPVKSLNPIKKWINSEFTQPGNLIVGPSGAIFVLDGWRTVVQLNSLGKIVDRRQLDLPSAHAINQLRVYSDSTGNTWFAGFSMLGKKLFVFDDHWRRIAEFPSGQTTHRGISDCLMGDFDPEHGIDLIVSFADETGIQQFNVRKNESKQLFDKPVKSLALNGGRILAIVDGAVVDIQSRRTILGNLKYRSLFSFGNNRNAAVIGSRDNGGWELCGLDSSSRQQWTATIGSQFIENELEPHSALDRGGKPIIAIADADQAIKLISENGDSIGYLNSEQDLRGLALFELDGSPALIVSHDGGVECWQLDQTGQTILPVSGKKRFGNR